MERAGTEKRPSEWFSVVGVERGPGVEVGDEAGEEGRGRSRKAYMPC